LTIKRHGGKDPSYKFPVNFGQIRTLELRYSARILQTMRFGISLLTRSLPHICAETAQWREISKAGSNPVRVALPFHR